MAEFHAYFGGTQIIAVFVMMVKYERQKSTPLRLVHEAITHGTILECPNEVSTALPTTWSPSGASGRVHVTISRRRIVCGTGL